MKADMPPECPYRSPKRAAREEAVLLVNGHEPRNLEASSPYDPEKHMQYPRMIELKPSRFAHTAVFIDKLADGVFEGEGDEVRLPALQKLRHRSDKMYIDGKYWNDPLLQLAYDWSDMDVKSEVQAVLHDPANKEHVAAYEEIALDIATDPNAIESAFDSEDELSQRINLSHSFESEVSGRLLIKWGLENPITKNMTPEEKRLFLIGLIPFFERMSELEVEHAIRYYHHKWNDFLITSEEGGVAIVEDVAGQHIIKLTEREKRPEKTEGQPIGCPAGFIFEDVATAGLGKVPLSKPTVIARALTAFVNEAYDRGILGEQTQEPK